MRRAINRLSEEILLVLYDRTANYQHEDWDLLSAFKATGNESKADLSEQVLSRMVAKGWVVAQKSVKLQRSFPVRVTEFGKLSAIQILERREPKSFFERLQIVPRSDWIALAALLISLAALFR